MGRNDHSGSQSRGASKRAKAARKALSTAASYDAWKAAANALDDATGKDAWRACPESPHYHHVELGRELARLKALQAEQNTPELIRFIHESLHRWLNDILEPGLYAEAVGGTKDLIVSYLDAMESTIEGLVYGDLPGWNAKKKLAEVDRAYSNLGRSALLLSGGATLGFYHLGVIKALWEAKLLPEVISGASMGAMIAAGVCGKTDEEIDELFATDVPDIDRVGLQWRPPGEAWKSGSLMRPERMLKTIRHNCGQLTFQEAFERSGRVLNISVAPTRSRQKPRILNYLTAPNVWIPTAALASSAVPGLFPPVSLMQRGRDGGHEPYIAGERWIDGSFGADLPMMRIGRLHNVNHFIVSQTQPHALPLMSGIKRRGFLGMATEAATSMARAQGIPMAAAGRRIAGKTPLRAPAELLHSMINQEYRGDIDIHPRFEPLEYRKLLKNPSKDDLGHFVREGEIATWPKIAMIADHTRISRCLARCQRYLQTQVEKTE
ncbi:MAG: TAG lipase/steryl ester hydrolase/phospholipase A2/LPA acyltransferase [Myxococcota bacterium]|jgi:TAG lipase/steryl ester hydrolase/phospholipase A2/LPA acyltransferase